MKRTAALVILLSGLLIGALPAQAQAVAAEIGTLKPPPARSTYDPAGRRDPFKNLLAGKDVKDKTAPGGILQLTIDDTTLVGIVKAKQKLTAIVSGPQGFPFFVKPGDKLADGYVLSINESQVVFRKTNERGIPLMRPKDIIKEINPEER
jgi:Tfp pilus assembly protein PilP